MRMPKNHFLDHVGVFESSIFKSGQIWPPPHAVTLYKANIGYKENLWSYKSGPKSDFFHIAMKTKVA